MKAQAIKGDTEIYGLVGYPISHSFSPQIHNFLFKEYELNCVYIPFNSKFSKKDFIIWMEKLKYIENLKGLNITIPYKEWACEITENNFKFLGTINCVKFKNGKIFATNTDIDGFKNSIKNDLNFDYNSKNILIFGAGATAKSIIFSIIENVEKIFIINRNYKRAENLKRHFKNSNKIIIKKPDNMQNIDLVINCTPIGIHGEMLKVDFKKFKKECCFFDVLYVDTPFIKTAIENGFRAINGLNMLIYQAIKSFEYWTSYDVDERLIKKLKKEVFLDSGKR